MCVTILIVLVFNQAVYYVWNCWQILYQDKLVLYFFLAIFPWLCLRTMCPFVKISSLFCGYKFPPSFESLLPLYVIIKDDGYNMMATCVPLESCFTHICHCANFVVRVCHFERGSLTDLKKRPSCLATQVPNTWGPLLLQPPSSPSSSPSMESSNSVDSARGRARPRRLSGVRHGQTRYGGYSSSLQVNGDRD